MVDEVVMVLCQGVYNIGRNTIMISGTVEENRFTLVVSGQESLW